MNFQAAPINSIVVFLIDVIGITLVSTVLLGKMKSVLKIIFILMVALMFIWINLAFFARIVTEESLALAYIRVAWSITPLLFVLLYSFMINLFGTARKRLLVVLLLYILGFVFLYITLFTDYIIASIAFVDGVLNIGYGRFVWFFFGWVALLTVYNFFILIRNFRRKDATLEMKKQIKILMAGLSIFFVANAIFNIILPVFFMSFESYEFGDYSLIVFMSIIAYSMVRENFFGFRMVGATFLSVFLGSFLLIDAIIFSTTTTLRLTKLAVFASYIPFGYLLVNSVYQEIKQKVQLQVLNKKLEELDRQKDEFLNVASHELRAPMTAVKGYVDMAQAGDGGEIPVKAQQFLTEAAAEIERMIRLVNNMLNVARIEEGRMVYEIGEVNLGEVVKRVFNEFKFEAESKALEYSYEPAKDLVSKVVVDVDRIHEVVGNLINNAIKYTDQGRVVVRTLNPSPGVVRVEVADTGLGMTKEEQQKLFQKFYRAESYVGKKMGSGLGLYISKLLVQKFGGTIGVKSEKGKGSLFWFELPVRR